MRRFVVPVLAGLAASAGGAAAQAPIPVSYYHEKTFRPQALYVVMDDALGDPAFARQTTKPGPDTLVLTVPDGWRYTDTRKKDHFRFMLVFTRNGDKLGESEEVCPVNPPYDCISQITSDIKSAATIPAP